MYKILNGNVTQLNTGTLEGKLYNSFNLDLTFNKGKISSAQRTILNTDSITNMGLPIGFKYFDTRWFTVAGSRVFKNAGTPQGDFTEDTSTGVPTDCSSDYSDIETFNDTLLVASADKLYTKASAGGAGTGAYTVRRTFSSVSDYHALCTYNNRAYWLDINEPPRIYSMDTSYSVSTSGSYTMQLPAEYEVTWMRSYSNGILIGTIHRFGGEALVFDWDGVTQNKWNRAYKVNAQGALAGYVINDIAVIMNSNAELMQFTGAGFKEVGRLPIKRNLLYQATNTSTSNRFIHPNGLCSINGYVSALINNRENNTTTVEYMENIHSGIWEFDGTSLYHKYALSYRTRPDVGGSITDYGQITLNKVGGLADTPDIFGTSENLKGNFLAGAVAYSTSSISTGLTYGIWSDNYYDDVEKSSFFSTVQIRAEHFKDMWQMITALYDATAGFNFVIKYRTEKPVYTDFDITWTSTTSFTTTQTGLAVGDEITIIQAKGSGRIAHISAISFSSPNFTVTLDETITGVTGTARARSENWKKLKAITKVNQKYEERIIGQPDTLVELKVAMLCTGEATIDELILDNKKNI